MPNVSRKRRQNSIALLWLTILLSWWTMCPEPAWAGRNFPFSLSGDREAKQQSWLDAGRSLRERRLFDRAIQEFNRILSEDPLDEEATFEIALTHFQAHRWWEAADWFYAAGALNPQHREAFSKRWEALIQLANGDTLLKKAAVLAIRAEISEFLREFPWDWQTLETARLGAQSADDSLLLEELSERLLHSSPNCPASYRLLADRFYEELSPIWTDAPRRISYLRDFLARYPENDFRETAYLFLFSALQEQNDSTSIRQTAQQWISEYPTNPRPYERLVNYLLDANSDPATLLTPARQAVELCRGWRGKPLKHVEQRLMEGKAIYAGTRLNMGRVLLALNRDLEAQLWLEEGQRNSGFTVDDEGTNAAFDYYLGQIAAQQQRWEEALKHTCQALVAGDTRGKWTALADTTLHELYRTHFSGKAADALALARKTMAYSGPVFSDATDSLGFSGVSAGRLAWGDANGDGYDDLLLNGWRLFINRRGKEFIEITDSCGFQSAGACGGVWADVDLDGDLDLFCAAGGDGVEDDRLYLNEGNDAQAVPRFRDVSDLLPEIRDGLPSEGAAWGDLQGDGRPDLYVANYEGAGERLGQGTPDFLYLNLADSTAPLGFRFQRLAPQAGLTPPFGQNLCGRGVNWGDFDNDGDQDIYVSNYRLQQNLLWVNEDADSLQEQACFFGVAGRDKEGWWGHTIGSEWGDFDNDGDLDLINANLAHPRYIEISDRTMLYENRLRQEGTFVDVRRQWGIKYEETHSDPAWGDFDADGDLDLYITSIYPTRRSFLYLNDLQNRRFQDVTYLAGVRLTNAWGCAVSDFDLDGDLDLAVGSSEGVRLYKNRGSQRHWLTVDVQIPGSAYGTRIIVKQGKNRQIRELQGGKGTTSQHSHSLYFGLGSSKKPVTLEIRLSSGERIFKKKVYPNQRLVIKP